MSVLATLRQRLFELFRAERAPAGYRPGVTLAHLRRNLGLATLEVDGVAFEIVERTESQLLMHLVLTEFVLRVPAATGGTASFDVHHGGAIRRTGIRVRRRSGNQALCRELQARLLADTALFQALMPLDFKRCTSSCKVSNGAYAWSTWAAAKWSIAYRPFVATSP